MTTSLDRISLRANAFVELHAWLAAAGRSAATVPPELEEAARAYERALTSDESDELVTWTTRAIAACADVRCATNALSGTPFAKAYESSVAPFLARSWTERATIAHTAMSAARAAFGTEAEAIGIRVARDLGVDWADRRVTIDLVAEAPPPGRRAVVPVVLSVRGGCFALRRGGEAELRMHYANIVDCVLVRAFEASGQGSPLHDALVRDLGLEGGERAWTLVVVHAVAATVTGWEPKHVSPPRRSAVVVEPAVTEWLEKNWAARANGAETAEAFAARYAAAIREKR